MVVCARTAAPPYGWPLLSVAQQQVLTRSDAVYTYMNLVCEGHLQKYKAGCSGNVDHVLHTSHSVVP